MKKKIAVLTVCLSIWTMLLFGNMANPMAPHSITGQLLPVSKVKVSSERIDIRIKRDTLEHDYQSHFTIVYHIQAAEAMNLPLLFLAYNLDGLQQVLVNQKQTEARTLDQPNATFPFLRRDNGSYEITYDSQQWRRVSLTDAFYFTARLKQGDNTVQVQYTASMGFDRRDILPKYEIDYLLFPSKYWSSFGPIDLYLHLEDNMEVAKQDIGIPEQQTTAMIHWIIRAAGARESFHIDLSPKTSIVAKTILWVSPNLLALIGSVALLFLHLRAIYRKYALGRNRFALSIGNLIVPASFYTFAWFWSGLANYLVNGAFEQRSRGFILMVVLTLPVLYLIYGLVLFLVDRSMRAKL